MEKSSKADRARQFMPFSALRGFEELIREVEHTPTPRRELSEYEAEILGKKLLPAKGRFAQSKKHTKCLT